MVKSPCINICKMDEPSGLCLGCLRTLDEIAGWGKRSDEERVQILARVARRRREHDPWEGDLPSKSEDGA